MIGMVHRRQERVAGRFFIREFSKALCWFCLSMSPLLQQGGSKETADINHSERKAYVDCIENMQCIPT